MEAAQERQARVVVRDDLARSRLTVFFRLILAIPHLIVVAIWGIAVLVVAIVSWFKILFTGTPAAGDMTRRYLRYYVHVYGYLYLAANPYPPFGGGEAYPLDLEVPEAGRQSRWKTAFRIILAVPGLMVAAALGGGSLSFGRASAQVAGLGAIGVAAFLGWFACLASGRMPRGLRDLIAYGLGYSAQLWTYLLLVTDKYPSSDPRAVDYASPALEHTVRITAGEELRRSRLTVFFRLFLFLPHLVWLLLWGIVVFLAIVANWFVTLFAGRPAAELHRFTSSYLNYVTHAFAFVYLVANPFPGFTGKPGAYEVDLGLPEPAPQNRWKTLFRLPLAIPALLLSGTLGNVLAVVAVLGWFTGLFVARMPQGLRNLGIFALRYQAQVNAYLWLLTDRYPFASPALEQEREPAAAAPAAPPGAPPPVPEPA